MTVKKSILVNLILEKGMLINNVQQNSEIRVYFIAGILMIFGWKKCWGGGGVY